MASGPYAPQPLAGGVGGGVGGASSEIYREGLGSGGYVPEVGVSFMGGGGDGAAAGAGRFRMAGAC